MKLDRITMSHHLHISKLAQINICLLIALVLSTSTLHAEWVIGADVIPLSDFYQPKSLSIEPIPAGSFDYQDDELKLFSGYKTSDTFLIALEYRNNLDLGTPSVLVSDNLLSGRLRYERFDNDALFLSGQRTFNVDDGKYLYLRGGLYNWDINTSDLAFNEEQNFASQGTDIFYSIGAAFDFSDSFGIRAEWERFAVDEEEVDVISTELRFNF
jgi:hypothetical protein